MLLHVRREHVGSFDSISAIYLSAKAAINIVIPDAGECERKKDRRNEIGTHNGIIIVPDEKDDRPVLLEYSSLCENIIIQNFLK